MKFLVFENLISEKFETKELDVLSVGEAIETLGLQGYFILIIKDKVYRYPEDKDFILPQVDNIIIKRIQKNEVVQTAVGAALIATGFITGQPWLITTGSTLVVSGVASMLAPKIDTSTDIAKPNYSLTSGSNSIPNIGDKYPCVFGKHRITPPLLANYFTSLSSNTGAGDQYITGLVCLGYNELSISSLQFGTNTLASNSTDVRTGTIAVESDIFTGSIEINQDGNLPTIYPNKMYEEQPRITITENETSNFTYVYSTPKKTKTIRAFISFAGIYYLNDKGEKRTAGGVYNMAFRKKGTSAWTTCHTKIIEDKTPDPRRYFLEHTFTPAQLAANPTGEWEVALWRSSNYYYWAGGTKILSPNPANLVLTMSYDAFQCVIDDVPMIASERAKMCLVAFRIKATESNTGSLDRFNCVAQRLMPAWDGINSGASGWTTFTKNSNPASAFLLALQGDHLPSAVADSRIDWTALESLYIWCESNSYECNGILSESQTTYEVLNKILSTCRAYFYMKSGLYSFIHDNYQSTPICILTPENSSDFKANKSFEEKATALEITYNNASDDYESTSEQVYPYGETPALGDTIDQQTVWGITNHDQIYKLARYNMASMKLRPESYEVKVGIEHFGLPLGSRVLLQHDILDVGIDSGYIKSIDSSTQITLRKKVQFNKIDSFAILIFKNDGTITTKVCDFTAETELQGYTDTIIIDDTTDINIDDVFAYGLSGSETIDCMIQSKTFESSPDMSSTLNLIGYNEAIYEASEQAIPDYESKISKIRTYTLKQIGTSSTEKYSNNNGNSVQDDGAVYFTFEDATINGTTLVNMGSYKAISDSIPTNLNRSTDTNGNVWADSTGTSLIPFKIDNIFYKNFSINFFVKDLDLTTDGYIYIYDDISLNNHISLRVDSGDLILKVQLKEVTIPITISGAGTTSMLTFGINFDDNLITCYENKNLLVSETIGIDLVTVDGDQVTVDGDDVFIYLASAPSNNDRDIYFNLLSSDATDGFVGSIRKFRIFGFALEASDVDSLYTNEYLLQNVLAAGRYLGELISTPTIVNDYDTFTYTGPTNVDFVNGKEYTWNGYKWIIWNL